MDNLYNDGIGVIGVYSSWKNLSNSAMIYHGDDDELVIQWDAAANTQINTKANINM